jgi:recombination protein RecA
MMSQAHTLQSSSHVEKSGSWYSYKGERIGQGRENARQFLRENHDIREGIDTTLRKTLGLTKAAAAESATVPAPLVEPPAKTIANSASKR